MSTEALFQSESTYREFFPSVFWGFFLGGGGVDVSSVFKVLLIMSVNGCNLNTLSTC